MILEIGDTTVKPWNQENSIVEEVEVYYVEVINRVTEELITDVFCGSDYDRALQEKDQLDMVWDDGSTYTVIVSDFIDEGKI